MSTCQQYAVEGMLGGVSQPKDDAWAPSKDRWATWVLESILFLAFASPLKEETEVLAGGHGPLWDAPVACADWVCGAHGLGWWWFQDSDSPEESRPGAPTSWTRLKDRGSWVPPPVSGCISLSGSTGKKISVRSCGSLLQAG